jgi:hypothetical protein
VGKLDRGYIDIICIQGIVVFGILGVKSPGGTMIESNIEVILQGSFKIFRWLYRKI